MLVAVFLSLTLPREGRPCLLLSGPFLLSVLPVAPSFPISAWDLAFGSRLRHPYITSSTLRVQTFALAYSCSSPRLKFAKGRPSDSNDFQVAIFEEAL